jgi:hypothetical protein
MDVTNADVPNVAPCCHCTSVLVGDQDDDLHSCVRKGVDLLKGTKWRAKKGRAGGGLNPVASMTLDNKGSQSSTSGSGQPPDEQAQNRIHKRVIMSGCGKQLNLASTRIALLQGLIDGITSTTIYS